MSEVRELHARYLITSGTFYSGVAVMEVVVLGPFGNFCRGVRGVAAKIPLFRI